ncbi:hypothetical protein ABT112_26820 [Streptomyces sp. NPDC002055]|uniref:hypothetical protein n=1 Tax=Streptomyces sp. NPDC002055 TaxID=3154534 RepID=UPI0033344557
MGAALHLAHAHQASARKRRPKQTGGGDGSTFAEYAHRIYQDQRADAKSRQLLLAVAYALTMAPVDEDTGIWAAVRAALGTGESSPVTLRQLVRHDLPRYAPPGTKWQNASAPAPVPNRGGLLPSYFDADFLKLYRWATTPSWQPPPYGLRADDWPIPGQEPVPQRARLRLITTPTHPE